MNSPREYPQQLQDTCLVYGDVCSGISAPTVAWKPLGWRPAFFAEVARFPSAVLKHHYPDVPNHGDFTTIQAGDYGSIDLLVGGTPCQDFSVAGLRAGLDGSRGQLTVEFARLASRLRPRWLVWENVPGILSSDGGRAFGIFLGLLGQLGYGYAYRVLDAQHFGVPQRRRRVFVVGHLGDWRRAAAVLFERHSLSGDSAPRRASRQDAAYDVAPCLAASGRGFERAGDSRGQDCVIAGTLKANNGGGGWSNSADHAAAGYMIPLCMSTGQIACSALTTSPYADNESQEDKLLHIAIQGAAHRENAASGPDGVGVRTDGLAYTLEARSEVQAVAIQNATRGKDQNGLGIATDGSMYTLDQGSQHAVAFNLRGREGGAMPEADDLASIRAADGGSSRSYLATQMAVRRLTPRECERLQGFPDDYTRINAKTADGPRYKALGNSMAVPVVRWIGERIAAVDAISPVQVHAMEAAS